MDDTIKVGIVFNARELLADVRRTGLVRVRAQGVTGVKAGATDMAYTTIGDRTLQCEAHAGTTYTLTF